MKWKSASSCTFQLKENPHLSLGMFVVWLCSGTLLCKTRKMFVFIEDEKCLQSIFSVSPANTRIKAAIRSKQPFRPETYRWSITVALCGIVTRSHAHSYDNTSLQRDFVPIFNFSAFHRIEWVFSLHIKRHSWTHITRTIQIVFCFCAQ